ncbi:hypothetical protein HYN49_04255 [Flavobacterium pallidum]|uniref:Uncharacterized protein n=1 Tax=Flavobacterium pallidum TaxID=2172098 RepID=A0A2S1SFJ3_9FLAO|nr:hypothetical protein HYN49_04255 [Flavobacterium pallidum]
MLWIFRNGMFWKNCILPIGEGVNASLRNISIVHYVKCTPIVKFCCGNTVDVYILNHKKKPHPKTNAADIYKQAVNL